MSQFGEGLCDAAGAKEEVSAKKQLTPAFLEKLFDILEDNRSYSHLIAWQPDGNSFIIKKVNDFSETVLPRYFKHSNIQSYIRQLNMYGFSKTRHDSNHHEFMHKLFQRGRRDLLPLIRRKTHQNPTKIAASDTSGLSDRANAGTKGISISPQLLQGTFMIQQANTSSEASKSSHGADEDATDVEPTVVEVMQSRILCLEGQVDRLSNVCSDLLTQHNLLCEALNKLNRISSISSLNHFGNSHLSLVKSRNSPPTNGFEDAPSYWNDNRPTSSPPFVNSVSVKRRLEDTESASDKCKKCSNDPSESPLKRTKATNSAQTFSAADGIGSCSEKVEYSSTFITDHNERNSGSSSFAVKSERGASISSHSDTTTSSAASIISRSPVLELDFLDFKVDKYQLLPFLSEVYKLAILPDPLSDRNSSTKLTAHRSRANQHCYSHGDPDVALLVARAGGNFDLRGLTAITDAASLLDDDRNDGKSQTHDEGTLRVKFPLFTSSAHAASHIGQTVVLSSNSSTTASQKDLQFIQDTTETLGGQGPKPGGALLKAYSIG